MLYLNDSIIDCMQYIFLGKNLLKPKKSNSSTYILNFFNDYVKLSNEYVLSYLFVLMQYYLNICISHFLHFLSLTHIQL